MKLLDLYCCQGGASAGYKAAGFDSVIGVDIAPQPRYPYKFWQRDALMFLERYGKFFDAIHASPPCQAYTNAQRIQGNEHPDLVEPTRELLVASGKPWVMENVPGSPLREDLLLCGAMFGIETYRHRVFEFGGFNPPSPPEHPPHRARVTKMGRAPVDGEYMHIVGNFSGVAKARQIMGMPWASRDGLREAIPPAYTEFIGRQLLAHLKKDEAA